MDIRLIASASCLALSILGYIALVLTGSVSEAKDLLTMIGLPSLTWILGAGSSLVTKNK